VVITSSDPSHAGYVLEALKAGKQVFCEKPLAQSAADCEKIIEAETAHGKRLVQVGFMRHYDRGYAEMKRIIDSGELGAPLMIHACHRNVSQPDGFQTEMGVSNVAIHELDICRWLLGDEYKSGQVLGIVRVATKGYDNPQSCAQMIGARIDVEVQVATLTVTTSVSGRREKAGSTADPYAVVSLEQPFVRSMTGRTALLKSVLVPIGSRPSEKVSRIFVRHGRLRRVGADRQLFP
ncbi:MAG: Gfo/Idh/MocA family protein, partial [Butyricicoccus sp.]